MDGCRIKLVTREKFNRLQTKYDLHHPELMSPPPWHSENMVRLKDRGLMELLRDCSGGGFTNGDQVTLFHLEPEHSGKAAERGNIENIFYQDTLELKKAVKKQGAVRGFLTGGVDAYEESKDLRGFLSSLMKRFGIHHISMIWGRKSMEMDGPTAALYCARKNTWYVNAQLDSGRNRDILTLADLQKAFQKIHIASGDTLVTADGAFTSKDLPDGIFQKGSKLLSGLVKSAKVV